MTTRIKQDTPTAKDEWDLYLGDIQRAINEGWLDRHLKSIAEACVARNHVIKDDPEERDARPTDTEYPATWYRVRAYALDEWSNDPTTTPRVDAVPIAPRAQPPARKRTVKQTDPGKRRTRKFAATSTFRFLDGGLYEKSGVIGQHLVISKQRVKITGVGAKAIKVTPIQSDGTAWPHDAANQLPGSMKSVNAAGTVSIKDPIFVGLKVIQPIVDRLSPVDESA